MAATRGRMGAFQKNTLESNLNFLRIAHENNLSSESVIRDADMATEMANFTRNQILMDSSVAMLAQANQAPMHRCLIRLCEHSYAGIHQNLIPGEVRHFRCHVCVSDHRFRTEVVLMGNSQEVQVAF